MQFQSKQDVVDQVTAAVESRDVARRRELFFEHFWECPPEPNWLSESRVWAFVPPAYGVSLLSAVFVGAWWSDFSSPEKKDITEAFERLSVRFRGAGWWPRFESRYQRLTAEPERGRRR